MLFSGHNHFTLDDEIRAKLGRYVLDGGLIVGDACCGWEDFNESFRQEMEAIFPQRPLQKLPPTIRCCRRITRLGTSNSKKQMARNIRAPPCVEGITLGCRLGVIYSPVDLTCGWDGHDHPRGLRVVVNQARQIGANYITYLLGNYQLSRFLSTSKVYHEAAAPSRDDFVMAQVIHEGDWDPDPSAIHSLLKFVRDNSTLEVKFKRANVRLSDPQAANYPLLYMTGHNEFVWRDEEVTRLKRFLEAGGMLVADACCGRLAFDLAFRRELAKVLPSQRLESLPLDHPLYSMHYDIRDVEYTPRAQEDFGSLATPTLEGITLDGRLAVAYSRFDLGNGWEQFPHPYAYGYSEKDAMQLGTNLLVYAVTH